MPAIEMRVDQVMLDPVLGTPVLVLGEVDGPRRLPIGIGQVEAVAIVSQLERIPMVRPMTHDLLRNLVDTLGATVEQVTVTDLREGIFYAEVTLRSSQGLVALDSRPSDAVALALRAGAPIFVEDAVIVASAAEQIAVRSAEELPDGPRPLVTEPEGCAELLESLTDEDFGKWKM